MEIIPGQEENWKASTTIGPSKEGELPREYYVAIIDFATSWAEEMEKDLAEGKALADIWQSSQERAKEYHELSGFMFNVAVSLLAHFWVHGDELRKLHNARYGYEGDGTVNSAIMTIQAGSTDEAVEKIKEAAEKAGGRVLTDKEARVFLGDDGK